MLLPLKVLQLPEGAGLARNLADLPLILLLLVLLATFLLVSRVGGDTQLKVIFLCVCAPCSELPSNISTMLWPAPLVVLH